MNYFLIAPNEGSSWHLSPVKTPFCLNRWKLGKSGKNGRKSGQKKGNFTNFASFLKNRVVSFFLMAPNEGSSRHLSSVKTPFWLNRPKLGKSGKIGQFYKLCLIFRYLWNELFSNHTKWRLIMTPFSSESAILKNGWKSGQKMAILQT